MGPYAGVDSRYVHSRVDANTFTMGNPMPESTLTPCQMRLYPHSGILDYANQIRIQESHMVTWLDLKHCSF
jgi:hypothetical protein